MERLVERLREAQAQAKLVGNAPAFLKAIRPLPSVARSDAAVLITGETGTGKELIARAIHYLSERAALAFVPVNCGSHPDTLFEDEFFGHERGAFTDAHTRRHGLIAQAEKGTLFLDEIEALTPKAQVSLLRVLQDKRYRAIGSSFEQQADVRIVAATNSNLEELVRSGNFRADLYYRLSVFLINPPPLRHRKSDIIPLVRHFLQKHAQANREALYVSPEVREALLAYDWPGNVRQLENAVIRAIHLSQSNKIELEDLGIPTITAKQHDFPSNNSTELLSFKDMKKMAIETFEVDYLNRLMQIHRGNVTHAALASGKERRELGKMLKKYRIDPKLFDRRISRSNSRNGHRATNDNGDFKGADSHTDG
jgi:DNA-binding NtrC family response regulator